MNTWESKCWGYVCHLFSSDHAAVSLLKLVKGYRCSKHLHRARINQFTVVSGRVAIEEWCDGAISKVELGPGQTYEVPVDVVHRFIVLESGEMVEVYWPGKDGDKVCLDDILRYDEGGRVE